MKYDEIKIEYVNSINDIIEKANNFSDIKNLNCKNRKHLNTVSRNT